VRSRGLFRKLTITAAAAAVLLILLLALLIHVPPRASAFYPFPVGRDCAIAITDDTDYFQFEKVDPVYAIIDSLGLRLTKTVWAFDAEGVDPASVGLSLEDPAYRAWVLAEAERGHEITLHSPSCRDDDRETILRAYALVETLVGASPKLEIFHSYNREAFYWGRDRLQNPVLRYLYGLKFRRVFEGQKEGSRYCWIDRARDLVRYVRTYTSNDINTLAFNPSMPYEDRFTPMAPLWFASSNGRLDAEFAKLFSEENVARLKKERGLSIVYTHFASGFVGKSDAGEPVVKWRVREALVRCGTDPVIEFVPAGEALDRLRVIQIIEDALATRSAPAAAGGTSAEPNDGAPGHGGTVAVPAELLYAVAGVSVDAERLPPRERAVRSARGGRVSLTEWLHASGIALSPSDRGVFEGPRQIEWRERWRLVLRWMATQLVSPTG
jgi:hypothetical protein